MRGISGVVIAVLLTVIGIVAVLAFWGMFSGMFNPQPKVIVEKATLTRIGTNQFDLSISVREVGGASTEIRSVIITGGDLGGEQTCSPQDQGDTKLSAGQQRNLVYRCNVDLKPGVTYYVAVKYTKGDGEERSDLVPVTAR